MKTMKKTAAYANTSSAKLIFYALSLACVLSGCAALPEPPARAVLYDFGPGALVAAPTDHPAIARAPLVLAELEAPGLPEGGSAVLYRLAYANAQQLRPYTQARWSQPPAQLVQQRLRVQLGQRRALLTAHDATRLDGKRPAVLRVELEEFSQVFTAASQSGGLLRLRATVVESAAAGATLLGQRVFTVQRPAVSADAAGGTRALAEAAQQVAQEVDAWLEQMGR